MIRKVCVVLVVCLAAMVGLKVVLTIRCGRAAPRAARAQASQTSESRKSQLPVTVYYTAWSPYAMENPLTHRNGYILDLARAVFPKARFVRLFGAPDVVASALTNDAHGVSVMFGSFAEMARFPCASTPTFENCVVVLTPRTNDWAYAGADSLKKLRLGFQEDYLVSPEVRDYAAANPDRVRVYKGDEKAYYNVAAEVLAGRLDGFVTSEREEIDKRLLSTTAGQAVEFKTSKPIGKISLRFIVSDRDPAFAQRAIDAYEKGVREVVASGELRRIRDYYGIPFDKSNPLAHVHDEDLPGAEKDN